MLASLAELAAETVAGALAADVFESASVGREHELQLIITASTIAVTCTPRAVRAGRLLLVIASVTQFKARI